MEKKILLSAIDLQKTFYTPEPLKILKGISINIEEGETIAIMGKSGEGKSTLLHILGTLEAPTSGTIRLAGKDVIPACAPQLRNQHIGFIFQNFNLLEDYSVLENVLMPAKISRRPTKKQDRAYQRALELVERVGLSSRLHFPIKLLSGGEKQMAAIARALCNDPDLILADEPSGNLDRGNSAIIHALLIETAKQFHKSLIVVTHDRELASLCDRILLLKDGLLCSY
jgi:lipoprotein-releasing system ATP-binding protein